MNCLLYTQSKKRYLTLRLIFAYTKLVSLAKVIYQRKEHYIDIFNTRLIDSLVLNYKYWQSCLIDTLTICLVKMFGIDM